MKNNIARIAAAVACGIALAAPIGASAYSPLTVFGDSFADAGNVFVLSQGAFPRHRLTRGALPTVRPRWKSLPPSSGCR